MIYLFPDYTLKYVCFCGINISIDWMKKRYDFKEKVYKDKTVRDNFKVD